MEERARSKKVMRTAIVLLLGAAAAACVFVLAERWIEERGKLPVVKTWGDLLHAREHDLGNGVKVRLGIEARECARWSGVMVYCATEGCELTSSSMSHDELGPVHVSVRYGGDSSDHSAKRSGFESLSKMKLKDARLLFAKAIHAAAGGYYEIQVRTAAGALLASANVRVAEALLPPWIPWDDPDHCKAGSLERHMALPAWDSLEPTAPADPRALLPTVQPAVPDPGFTIQRSGNGIDLASDNDLLDANPWHYFLARWWVNGESFVPAAQRGIMKNGGHPPPNTQRLHFPLALDPALRAKSGDTIGLQILFCPQGWSLVNNDFQELSMITRGATSIPRLSNRIEFTAP